MNRIAVLLSLALISLGLILGNSSSAQSQRLGIGNDVDTFNQDEWFGPFTFSSESEIFAHLTSMQQNGPGVAIKVSRNRDPQRLENAVEITTTTGPEPVRVIAGDNSGPLYLWANVPQAVEDMCLIDGYNATVLKSPAARNGQTILVLTGQRRLRSPNNPCP